MKAFKRYIYNCEFCNVKHPTVELKGPKDKAPRLYVVDCKHTDLPKPHLFVEIEDVILKIK